MHLDINLPLLSELEQLCKAFWKNHNHTHNQDKALVPLEEKCLEPDQKSPSPKESNHPCQSHSQNSPHKSDLNSEQHTPENPNNVKTGSQDSNSSCRSVCENVDRSPWETDKDSEFAAQPNSQHEPLKPLQVSSPLLSNSSRSKRTSQVLWDKSTEDSSLL